MNRAVWLLSLFSFVVGTGWANSQPAEETAANMAALMKQRRDAARKTYEVTWQNYREGRAPQELVYRWSRRWLQAEKQLSEKKADQIKAFTGHSERMAALEALVQKLQQSKQVTVDEISALAFYRTEAEIWLLQAKKEAKQR